MRRVHHRVGDEFRWGEWDEWLALVTDGTTVRGYIQLADAGVTAGRALTTLALEAEAARARRREALVADLERRLCAPEAPRPAVRVSVVVCTHRRPDRAARVLEALSRLDPPAHETIVVDNDPGAQDVRAAAERVGARYVREDARGLNRARARGLEMATGDAVAFCDDDCLPPPHWLEPLVEAFADETVGGLTGPAFALGIDTEAQLLRDRYAGFVQPLDHRRVDWTTVRPVASGAIGAGANMAFRRALLEDLGDVFPAELDAGTPAMSGGDLYVLYRVLAAGAVVVRHPSFWLLHDHPTSEEALDTTLLAYGTGFSAFLTKVLVEERELAAIPHWSWLVRAALGARLRSLVHPDRALARLRWRYMLAGFRGAPAWLGTRSPRAARPAARALPASRPDAPPPADAAVIVSADPAERNARARAASTRWLVFLPPATPDPGAQAALHVRAHERHGRPALVAGGERVDPFGGSLGRQYAALRVTRRAATRCVAPTPFDVGSGGLSVARDLFGELGGFPEDMAAPAAAAALAFAARERGVDLVLEPAATTPADLPHDLREAVRATRREGRDRARLAARHPEVPAPASRPGAPLVRLARTGAGARALAGAADALEAARLRGLWIRLARALHEGAQWEGWLEGGGARRGRPAPLRIDLDAPAPIDLAGRLPGPVEICAGPRRLATLHVRGERWGANLAQEIVNLLTEPQLSEIDPAPPPVRPDAGVLAECTVVAAEGARLRELAAAGAATVALGDGPVRWRDVDRAIREAATARVAVPFPGLEVSPAWLAVASAPLEGGRVALVGGWGVPEGSIPAPTTLFNDDQRMRSYPLVGPPLHFVVVSRRAYLACGGVPEPVAGGSLDVGTLFLLERLLHDRWTIALQEAPGARWCGERGSLRGWRRRSARGELLGRDTAGRSAPEAAAWLLGHAALPEAGSLIRAAGSRSGRRVAAAAGDALATAAGVAAGVRAARRGQSRTT